MATKSSKQLQIQSVSWSGSHILVNNAGTIKRSPAHEFSDDDWNEVITINSNGVFKFCREAGKHMLKTRFWKTIILHHY